MATKNAEALAAVSKKYEWGFATEVEQDFAHHLRRYGAA